METVLIVPVSVVPALRPAAGDILAGAPSVMRRTRECFLMMFALFATKVRMCRWAATSVSGLLN